MTLEEAEQIARIAANVDSGCSTCVRQVVKALNDAKFGYLFFYADPSDFGPDEYIDPDDRVTVKAAP